MDEIEIRSTVAKDYSKTIALRIPDGLLAFMDQDIEAYKDHRNRSEYIVCALREYEARRSELKRGDSDSKIFGEKPEELDESRYA